MLSNVENKKKLLFLDVLFFIRSVAKWGGINFLKLFSRGHILLAKYLFLPDYNLHGLA